MLALSVCFPQACSSAGRRFAASRSWVTTGESFRFHKNKFDENPYELESTENPHSFEKTLSPPLSDKYQQI